MRGLSIIFVFVILSFALSYLLLKFWVVLTGWHPATLTFPAAIITILVWLADE